MKIVVAEREIIIIGSYDLIWKKMENKKKKKKKKQKQEMKKKRQLLR